MCTIPGTLAFILPTDVDCIWVYKVCGSSGEWLAMGRMMKWKGLGGGLDLEDENSEVVSVYF